MTQRRTRRITFFTEGQLIQWLETCTREALKRLVFLAASEIMLRELEPDAGTFCQALYNELSARSRPVWISPDDTDRPVSE